MQWSPQQDAALKEVARWVRERDRPFFYLAGFAGTGKTTLLREVAPPGTLFASYTGKAAAVMRAKGCDGATTLHSLMYQPKDKARKRLVELESELAHLVHVLAADPEPSPKDVTRTGELKELIAAERENLRRPAFALNEASPIRSAPMLAIDEVSMLDSQMGEDALHFGTPILVLGDPAQLPPIRGAGYFTSRKPDVMLTEVHRQALESPVLWLATKVRQGESISLGNYGSSWVRPSITPEEALEADQLLVGLNATRRATNARVRGLRKFAGALPNAGERLVCLANNHDLGLLNGVTYLTTKAAWDNGAGPLNLTIRREDGDYEQTVSAHREYFDGDPKDIDPWDHRSAESFDYAYAMTVHKAQGSEWDRVVLFDEWFHGDSRKQWLYTAVTRAADRIGIVRAP